MPLNCPTVTLSQAVDLYLGGFKGMDKRKAYKQHLILAQEVWKDIFQNTLFSVSMEYVDLIKGTPFNYVEIPTNSLRFFGLSVEDRCHNLKPLYYNDNLNVLVKPKKKPCGCETDCGCGGLCEAVGNPVPVTKEVVIDGQTYIETTWIKTCPNGDIMEYRTIPTTEYTFNRGSYDNSYDISYEIGTSGSNVVYYDLSRKLCNIELLPCGCPAQTKENEAIFFQWCGCFVNPYNFIKTTCVKHWGECNYYAGSCKLSPCGTKVFIEHLDNFDANQQLVLAYQTNGINPSGLTNIPDYAKMCLYTGMQYYKNLFNDRISPRVKEGEYYKYMDEQNKLILYNNLIAIEWLESLPQMATW